MKQFNFQSRFLILLLGFLTIGISHVWGADLVSTISDLSAGKYYITALNNNTYYTVPNTTIDGQTFTCTAGAYSNDKFTPAEGTQESKPCVFEFTKAPNIDNAYYIYNPDLKKYLVATGSKKFGYVEKDATNYGYWTFSDVNNGGLSGKFSITHSNTTHYMRAYNGTVRCYDGASNQGVYLMKAAATGSIEINPTNSNLATNSYADKTIEVNDITFGYTQWYKNTQNPFNIQAAKSKTNSLYNVDAIPGIIKSITFVQAGTARAIKVYGGTSTKPTTEITAPTTMATMTFDFSGKSYTYFSMTTPGNACYFDKITIEYEAAPSKTLSSIAVTTQPSEKNYTTCETLDLTGCVVTATYSDNSTENVTSQCTFNPANGAALTTSVTSVAVSYEGKAATISNISVTEGASDTYVDNVHGLTPSGDFSCSYKAPSLKDRTKGETSSCEDTHYHFVGWVEDGVDPQTNPVISAGTDMTGSNKTYKAVWAKEAE